MKICYLADANSVHTKKWCRYFKDKGHELHVISLNQGEIDGVDVHTLNMDLKDVRSRNKLKKFKYVLKFGEVKKLLKEINPDILHAHFASSYGILGALTNFHPFILSVWGSDVYDFPNKGAIFKSILKYNFSKADIIMSTSMAMAEETRKYTNKEIEITPFGVDIDLFKPRRDNNKNNGVFTVGIMKSLEPVYGIEYLIRAISIVKKVRGNIRLEIAGDGSQRKFLEELARELNIEDIVTFHGRLTQDKVIKLLKHLDAAVFPSLFESFGVAAVEAQACGVPVIVSNVGGLPEATSPGKSSIVVNPKSEREISEAIINLMDNPELKNQMAQSGRKYIEEKYDLNKNFDKIESIYDKILK